MGLGELFIPRACAGCGAAGVVLCGVCQQHLREVPHPIARRRALGAPVWALGGYTRVRRNLIIQMKEYNNLAVRPWVGAVVAAGVEYLQARGELPAELILVPAPTRARSARLRGGDPILHLCQAAARTLSSRPGIDVDVAACLRLRPQVADQSLLDAEARWHNMRGAVQLRGPAGAVCGRDVVLVDDVATTGATLAASFGVLRAAGARPRAGLVLADAR